MSFRPGRWGRGGFPQFKKTFEMPGCGPSDKEHEIRGVGLVEHSDNSKPAERADRPAMLSQVTFGGAPLMGFAKDRLHLYLLSQELARTGVRSGTGVHQIPVAWSGLPGGIDQGIHSDGRGSPAIQMND
jgi:hypothetical protein